jgi:hypothetical protein
MRGGLRFPDWGGGGVTIISARESAFPIPGNEGTDGMKLPALPPTELTPLCRITVREALVAEVYRS